MNSVKQVIVVRKDLNMSIGKTSVQVAHASSKFLLNGPMSSETLKHLNSWKTNGQTKVCLSVESEDDLLEIYKSSKNYGIETHMVEDLGLTELRKPTTTAVAIGPSKVNIIDKITKELNLL